MSTPKAQIILIQGRPLKYRVRRHRRARKIGVQVSGPEGVVVTIPWRVSYRSVPGYLADLSDWLQEKADAMDCWQGPHLKQYATGSLVPVFGTQRCLVVEPLPTGRSRARFTLEEDALVLQLSGIDMLDPRPHLEKFLRRLAGTELREAVAAWADRLELLPSKVVVGERKSRWGSCSATGTISLCYRLVMAPRWIIDAVVVHELCHLRHLNHGRQFYALLERCCPRHSEARQWLRENHDELRF